MTISVAIPSYGRDAVLVDSIASLLALDPPPWELLVVDQTPRHDEASERQLALWQEQGRIRWIRQSPPSITAAMNRALEEARGDRVLFLDDDIIPAPRLLQAHAEAAALHPDAMLAGRVLQPWHGGLPDPDGAPFLFNSLSPRQVKEFMGGNVSIPRQIAIDLGGFDRNFVKVAYRFEAEFAHRWVQAGHPIQYVPEALIHHLKAGGGGTRSYGDHLHTIRPDHAVGRYYFQMRTREPLPALAGSGVQLLRSIRTRHHLRRPWWIPATLVAELRGFLWALRLQARGPALLTSRRPRLLIAGSHPVQYHTPLFQVLAADPRLQSDVLYLSLPTPETQGLGFGRAFQWDVPLLEGYSWHLAGSGRGRGITSGYAGVRLKHPMRELRFGPQGARPDAILLTGWHFLGLVQLFVGARLRRIPVLLRMDSNHFRPRSWILDRIYWLLFRGVSVGLPVGKANAQWYRNNGFPSERMVTCPHYIDNDWFAQQAAALQPERLSLRQRWQIPPESFCFLFAGKLQTKKRPLDLLAALDRLQASLPDHPVHLLVVGSGHLEEECRNYASERGLPVSFAGFLNQSEIPAAYAATDCLVLPSDHGETWGLVVNEAMACGLPAIVSDQVGCAEDLIVPGETGLVVPFGDVEALADSMARMASDPARAILMGRQARQRLNEGFTIEAAAEGILRGLDLALAGRRTS
ncbi:MAG: glycosyltransferase [Cyanobacteriota bacterium]